MGRAQLIKSLPIESSLGKDKLELRILVVLLDRWILLSVQPWFLWCIPAMRSNDDD